MADTTFKKIDIVGTSSESFSKAASNAIEKAAKTIHGICWFEVVEQRGAVADGKISQYQTTVSIGFKLDD
jgi:flavin-binding protein dodecin